MIDVIDPSSSSKYGDTAESSSDPGEPPSTALSQTAVTVTATATSTPTASIDITDNHLTRSIATAARLIANETQLRARGRGLALELDDDGIPIDEDVEEAEEVDDVEEVDLDTSSAFPAVTHPGPGSPLKASLLDYVLSEVARNSSGMDLEHMNVQVAPRRISSRKYAFNPEESQDCPPHLSEYFERNVIAVLNRCDPMTWGRCLSCGNPPAGDVGTTNNEVISCNNNHKNGGNVVTVTAAGSSDVDVDTPVQVWNYYNYKSDYRTNGYLGGNGNQAYQYHSEPTSPFQASSAPPHHHQFFPDAATGSGERMRCGSDDGGGGASGGTGNGVVATQNDLEQSNAAGQTNMMEDEEVFTFDARLLSEAFLSSGRVDHTIQLMAYHPDYLEIFLRTHHFLMRGDGPLPYNFRNYIAIMAAARYRCSYLMELQKREFLYQGGDPNWLRGLDCAPPKLTALYNINKVMAHRPWVLKKEDLQHLTKKAGWSLSEVVQAVVILAHFHSLSSFIHGCGITPELDFDNGHTFLLDPATMGGSSGRRSTTPDISSDAGKVFHSHSHHHHPHQHQHHHLVSFALDNPAGPVPCSSTPGGNSSGVGGSGATKQTKSILKKTDVCSSNTNNHNNNNSATSGSINVINVPTAVHFHPYHHPQHQQQHFSASSVPSSLNSSPTQNSSLLKSDTLHNSLCGNLVGSPPRGPGGKILGVASSSVSEVDIIMATMKNLSETSPIEDPEEKKKRFETVARSDVDNQDQKENLQKGQVGQVGGHHVSMLPPDVTPFISEPEFTYEDFAKRGQISELHTFRIQDYSWEEHGYSLVNRLYAEVGQILDDKFKVAQSMTYYTIGGRANVDTTKFRTAVWNYIQCLYGIRHDDYDYGEVNQLLERPLKTFIKTVCCYPERITKADYDNVMREFKHSEKVHVNLMIMEAKLQAELLYALRTVMKLMF